MSDEPTTPTPEEALRQAIEKIGSEAALAAALEVTPQAVNQWTVAPHLRVLAIEKVTGVPRHYLRPDLYPPPESEAA